MTKEEFIDSVREMVDTFPADDFNEVKDLAAQMVEHDPVMAQKVEAFIESARSLVEYGKKRLERA